METIASCESNLAYCGYKVEVGTDVIIFSVVSRITKFVDGNSVWTESQVCPHTRHGTHVLVNIPHSKLKPGMYRVELACNTGRLTEIDYGKSSAIVRYFNLTITKEDDFTMKDLEKLCEEIDLLEV